MTTYFQSFEDPPGPGVTAPRLAALRKELKSRGLDGFIVPRSDEHQGEYVPARAERLAWLTGFTGSAGLAIVLADKAVIFVDGRYTLQVRDQIDPDIVTPVALPETKPSDWLAEHASDGIRIGFDPWLVTISEADRFRGKIEKAGGQLVALDSNPIDAVWPDQPEAPIGGVMRQSDELAGLSATDKLSIVRDKLKERDAEHLVLTDPASIAWLFNIRGTDIAHNPLPLGFALIAAEDQPRLFMDGRKFSNEVRSYLAEHADLREPDAFHSALTSFSASTSVLVDAGSTADAVRLTLEGAGVDVIRGGDPIKKLKAIKNEAERAGARAAHRRDGVAVVRFLAWLDQTAGGGSIDEIQAAKRLEEFRQETGALKEISFDTISGSGPHGAIVHYRVTEQTNRRLEPGSLYLVDSGGQYVDGTTDITRTVAIGDPTDDMRRAYTLVLKGHLALSRARFPKGTTGAQLDTLARMHMWQAGLDFDHGTGHGVGAFLCVHEGPVRIARTGTLALEPGMILSNEPGYYREGAFGIRIETLVLVTEPEPIDGGERDMMAFETLTLAPIDRRLVDIRLLDSDEIGWLDAYHRRVFEALSGDLGTEDRRWLKQETAPLS